MTVVLALGIKIPSMRRGEISYKNLEMEGLSCTGCLLIFCGYAFKITINTTLFMAVSANSLFHYFNHSLLYTRCGCLSKFIYVHNFIYVGYHKFLISTPLCSTPFLATKVQLFFLCMVLELSWSIFVTI